MKQIQSLESGASQLPQSQNRCHCLREQAPQAELPMTVPKSSREGEESFLQTLLFISSAFQVFLMRQQTLQPQEVSKIGMSICYLTLEILRI